MKNLFLKCFTKIRAVFIEKSEEKKKKKLEADFNEIRSKLIHEMKSLAHYYDLSFQPLEAPPKSEKNKKKPIIKLPANTPESYLLLEKKVESLVYEYKKFPEHMRTSALDGYDELASYAMFDKYEIF